MMQRQLPSPLSLLEPRRCPKKANRCPKLPEMRMLSITSTLRGMLGIRGRIRQYLLCPTLLRVATTFCAALFGNQRSCLRSSYHPHNYYPAFVHQAARHYNIDPRFGNNANSSIVQDYMLLHFRSLWSQTNQRKATILRIAGLFSTHFEMASVQRTLCSARWSLITSIASFPTSVRM